MRKKGRFSRCKATYFSCVDFRASANLDGRRFRRRRQRQLRGATQGLDLRSTRSLGKYHAVSFSLSLIQVAKDCEIVGFGYKVAGY